MGWNLLTLLTRLIVLPGAPIAREMSIDDFVQRVQRTLMLAPYGRELRRLRTFALRHKDPQFAQAFLAKEKLFDQQQREFRPPGALGALMYLMERMLGRFLSSRALVPGILVVTAAATALVILCYPNLRLDDLAWRSDPELFDPYAVRIDRLPPRDTEKPFDDWIEQQVLAAIKSPAVREELRGMLKPADRETDPGTPGPDALTSAIERAIPDTLRQLSIKDSHRDELLRVLSDQSFAKSLAGQTTRVLRDTARGTVTNPMAPDEECSHP